MELQSLDRMRSAMVLTPLTSVWLLPYLALYSGDRHAVLNSTLQEPAFDFWARRVWSLEAEVAARFDQLVGNASTPSAPGQLRQVVPKDLIDLADSSCQGRTLPDADEALDASSSALCAVLVAHNVLRTLGRSSTEIDPRTGADYLPPWYDTRARYWAERVPEIESRMIPLRRHPGERWGPWYHTVGVRDPPRAGIRVLTGCAPPPPTRSCSCGA